MRKFLLGAVASTIAATTIFAIPASASAITNDSECAAEGGTMVNVKNSDFCLVPIRPEAYNDPVYDGNQLGVTECPGNKLNDGLYCMYPVTIRPQTVTPVVTPDVISPDVSTTNIGSDVMDTASDVANDMVDDAIDEAVDDAVDAAKDETGL